MLTSKGQNGGAVTFTANGMVFGIYTEVINHPDHGSNMSMCVRITEDVVGMVEKF